MNIPKKIGIVGIVGILLFAIMIPLAMSATPTINKVSGPGVPLSTLTNDQVNTTKDLISVEILNNTNNIKKLKPKGGVTSPQQNINGGIAPSVTPTPIPGGMKSPSSYNINGYTYTDNLYQQVTGLDNEYYSYGGYINILLTVKAWYKYNYPNLGYDDVAPIPYSQTYVYLKYWDQSSKRWRIYDNQYKLTETNGEVNFGLESIPYYFMNQYSTTWMITIYSYSSYDNEYTYYTKTFYTYNY